MRPVPVSTVDADWLERTFLPEVRDRVRASDGAPVFFTVDSLEEADYLLEFLSRQNASLLGRQWWELVVNPPDPLSVWSDIAGEPDRPSRLLPHRGKLVGVRNGCCLPPQAILDRLDEWSALALGYDVRFLVPQYGADWGQVPTFPDVIRVPAFLEAPLRERRALAERLLLETFPQLAPAEVQQWASDIVDAAPSSRTELQEWIDYLGVQGSGVGIGATLPPRGIARTRRSAAPARSREQLKVHLQACLLKLETCNELFLQWQGAALFRPIHPTLDPFEGSSPIDWFVAVVSVLSCHLFDSADGRLELLAQYRASGGDVARGPDEPPDFLADLRALRTLHQHGLIVADRASQPLRDTTASWFLRNCGLREPGAPHFRVLTDALLRCADTFLLNLQSVLLVVRTCPSASAIEDQLDIQTKRMPKHAWREILLSEVQKLGVECDVEAILARDLNGWRAAAAKSTLRGDSLISYQRELVTRSIAIEASRVPVTADDLLALGIPKGRLIGMALREAQAAWDKDPAVSRETLLENARRFVSAEPTSTSPGGS